MLNYDRLPSPVDFHTKNVSNEIGWAYETTLDVEWAHAMTPLANIALVTVPVAETQGVQGLRNLVNAQQWVLQHHIGTIWSNSYATTEQAFHATSSLLNLNTWYTQAAAAGVSAILVYESFDPTGAGWAIIGGTSAATPQWAAIDALANQADGSLGFLTPRLYQVYSNPAAYAMAFHDITAGNNSWAGITGYAAGPGWDPATGLGTPDVAHLVTTLAATS